MKNKFFFFVLLLIAASCKNENNGSANIEVNKTQTFGTIKVGDTISKTFIIKNISDNTLKIKDIKSSCGCTIAKIKDSLVKGNNSTEIIATYTAGKDVKGDVSKSIVIDANTNPRFTVLYLKGKVQ
jgi:hypothetical protein